MDIDDQNNSVFTIEQWQRVSECHAELLIHVGEPPEVTKCHICLHNEGLCDLELNHVTLKCILIECVNKILSKCN